MRLFLTNDDGIHAPGIMALAKALVREHEVFVVAPDYERSASSHSLTLSVPLRYKEVCLPEYKGLHAYAVNGTPVDCVVFALEQILPFKPDCVISGINNGWNLGDMLWYSGTFNAAAEAHIYGYAAMAISCSEENQNFNDISSYLPTIFDLVKKWPSKEPPLLNINIPGVPFGASKGVCFARTGKHVNTQSFMENTDPFGRKYFWFPHIWEGESGQGDTDIDRVKNDYLTITPVRSDLNDYAMLRKLNEMLQDTGREL